MRFSFYSNFKPISFWEVSRVLVLSTLITSIIFISSSYLLSEKLDKELEKLQAENSTDQTPIATSTEIPQNVSVRGESVEEEPWGVAKQINETTWTMKVGQDARMATIEEILIALNSYRNSKGAQSLILDEKLSEFARKRAETFVSIGKLDGHAGFNDYVKNEDNIRALGVTSIGENSSIGYQLEGVHLIEWLFAGDPPHENNQLNPEWNHVGIGIQGTAVDIIFGKK